MEEAFPQDRKTFSAAFIQLNSSSQAAGMSADEEANVRFLAADFIQRLGNKLYLYLVLLIFNFTKF